MPAVFRQTRTGYNTYDAAEQSPSTDRTANGHSNQYSYDFRQTRPNRLLTETKAAVDGVACRTVCPALALTKQLIHHRTDADVNDSQITPIQDTVTLVAHGFDRRNQPWRCW